MAINWDIFQTNIGESFGSIKRDSFIFKYYRFEIWQGGVCINSGNSNSQIIAQVTNEQLDCFIDDNSVNDYIIKRFSFGEISTINDRIMWSKDIFNTMDKVERNNPDIASLFFKQGVLNKVTFTIHDPNILIEFYLSETEINFYQEIKIGSQTWMQVNLNSNRFANGDLIPQISTQDEWLHASENKLPACCYYDNNPDSGKEYGLLYNWYAVNDPRGLAPKGWHVPSDDEWLVLINFLGGKNVAGRKLKSLDLWDNYGGKSGN